MAESKNETKKTAKEKTTFEVLNAVNVNEKVEQKNDLNYLSWADAWAEVKKIYPDAHYEIWKDENNLPYVFDEKTGYMVYTRVTIQGQAHDMWLPVMDSANKAMKDKPYTYTITRWEQGAKKKYERTVDACTMFDINKTIMRCLTKNLAMFGLGLYIYAKEDFPEGLKPAEPVTPEGEKKETKVDARGLIALNVNDDNWGRASRFIVANKELGFDKIMAQLRRKYTIDTNVAKEIEKLITK